MDFSKCPQSMWNILLSAEHREWAFSLGVSHLAILTKWLVGFFGTTLLPNILRIPVTNFLGTQSCWHKSWSLEYFKSLFSIPGTLNILSNEVEVGWGLVGGVGGGAAGGKLRRGSVSGFTRCYGRYWVHPVAGVRVAALANVVDKQNIKQGTLEIYKGDISIWEQFTIKHPMAGYSSYFPNEAELALMSDRRSYKGSQ